MFHISHVAWSGEDIPVADKLCTPSGQCSNCKRPPPQINILYQPPNAPKYCQLSYKLHIEFIAEAMPRALKRNSRWLRCMNGFSARSPSGPSNLNPAIGRGRPRPSWPPGRREMRYCSRLALPLNWRNRRPSSPTSVLCQRWE
jgi:hypothetical protein